ncbi:hypothetical protein [Caldimonas aquatica]|uniref:Uncharacterized protein n=1 Tax=Caldimonas aquatica TaxID=376175 RepID=A0ABY6MW88_9BURK|nr:hypothetical protein [Schlegelella aquatica]UZD56278.1 hypothetical protein OMP39_06840 [Schlegelella aquatica]
MATNDFGNSHWSMMIEQFSGTSRPAPAAKRRPSPPRSQRGAGAVEDDTAPATAEQALRQRLLTVVQHMRQRRMDLIDEGELGPLLALDWLEWHGGALKLTITGRNVCDQMRAYAPAEVEADPE